MTDQPKSVVSGDCAAKTPLQDLLRRIPKDAVYRWEVPEDGREVWQLGWCSSPIGRLAHEAADALAAAPLPQGENADHVVEPNDMVSGSAAWDREVCTGCTSSLSIADIKARGVVSCCPDRHMVRIGDLVDAYTARPPRILPQTEKGS
jgi:hypothetical protein